MILIPRQMRSERGVTFIELTIVAVIASLVMAGLVAFYMSSQATWMDGSTQAITQREATSLVEKLSSKIRMSASAQLSPDGRQLDLFDKDGVAHYGFVWNGTDELVHEGPFVLGTWSDEGASMVSKTDRFDVTFAGSLVTVTVELRSAQDQPVEISTSAAMLNWTGP